jgi:CRP/FNR family cyclic AMP-dependent transcriptional regulator
LVRDLCLEQALEHTSMSAAEAIELLGRTPLFAGLDAASLELVARSMREVRFAARQTIFARYEAGSNLLLILEGRARLSIINAEGRELTVRVAQRGDLIGEIAALDGGLRSADGVAATAMRALALQSASLWTFIETSPPLARAAIRFLCARLRSTTEQVESIALYPIEMRLARFLLSALRLGGVKGGKDWIGLDMELSQGEIALLLGTSRPKINVALGALEEGGAIRRDGEGLSCRPDHLRDICGAE